MSPCRRRLLTVSVILAVLPRVLPQPPNFCPTEAHPPPRRRGGGLYACPDCSTPLATADRGAAFEANVLRFRNSLQGMSSRNISFLSAPFAAASGDTAEDTVYGLAACAADAERSDCAACLALAATHLPRIRCAGRRDMFLLYGDCLVRYDGGNATAFFGVADTSPERRVDGAAGYRGGNFSDATSLRAARARLAGRMLTAAAESPLRFAFDEEEVAMYVTLHELAQCTQDLTIQECGRCLASHMARLDACCADIEEVRFYGPSCYLRYEFKPFLPRTPPAMAAPLIKPQPPPPSLSGGSAGSGSSSRKRTRICESSKIGSLD